MSEPAANSATRLLFVTGRLAEPALRAQLDTLAPRAGFTAEIAVLPITVAALMTPAWVARHLRVPPDTLRVILPGHCRGDLAPLQSLLPPGCAIERGPIDLRDLPAHFGQGRDQPPTLDAHDIAILAEINHAPTLSRAELLDAAARYRAEGADLIDLGCDPGASWTTIGDAVKALRDAGHRVSVDSFDPAEIQAAVAAGAELVLSVNATNRDAAADWGAEVVAIPDLPGTLDGLDETLRVLERQGTPYRIDPILEPIGFGFAASLGRYLETRRRYPDTPMLMGIGNLTELTDVDSAGINVLLIGFCQEVGIRSVLTTAVINWARSSVRELDRARRICYHAVAHRTLPKHLDPSLVLLRDPRVPRFGPEALAELQRRIRDPNWRLFAEDQLLYALNGTHFLVDPDPFELFDRMGVDEPGHAFYLGYELAKAHTALTLSKAYRQDEALDWGFLTRPEVSHLERRKARRHSPGTPDPTDAESPP